ncbi:MAG: radical SAM protein [bacterium]|nr:radical SAM protein [bacterium]
MEILATYGREDLALLYVGRTSRGSVVEFVESVQPPIQRDQKWVLIISTLKGCPVRCQICDAGGDYQGMLELGELYEQIDAMLLSRFPDRRVPTPKFKIQFARMGEPSLNPSVLLAIRDLKHRYQAPGLMPCISSVLPGKSGAFFDELRTIKEEHYSGGRFQLQFSLHTTDPPKRRELIPYPVLTFREAARIGEAFFQPGDRKIALNFAAAVDLPIDADVIREHFNPVIFMIKLTPLNPTNRGQRYGWSTAIDPISGFGAEILINSLQKAGYEVILSLGESEEDRIRSNCGQYAGRYLNQGEALSA